MSQINIVIPDNAHVHESRVIYGDTDSGGVVYYGNYLRYFEVGRTEFLRSQGLTYREMEEMGLVLPVVEAYSRYKAPAKYDDLIIIKSVVLNVKRFSCRFNYRIERKADHKLLVKGYTVHAVVNKEGKLSKLPDDIFNKMQQLAK